MQFFKMDGTEISGLIKIWQSIHHALERVHESSKTAFYCSNFVIEQSRAEASQAHNRRVYIPIKIFQTL